ncbi:MAG: Tyrosine recombinase XerC [Parcubacteria group bacterium GW2011_GWA2_43_11]|nr:MAG: Tyrosine recombinase XerC [Parcubacteria group bacterium GW2011_GWC2_42_11]KKS83731.1 MAG: Tyrosine recombinase XerC [Parcubacteria group bacterium GW2011_GWA2_43_11]
MAQKTKLIYLKEKFLHSLETEQGKSKKTVENYTRYIDRFLSDTHVIRPDDITLSVVEAYRVMLSTSQNGRNVLKSNTQNYHLTALRRFLVYLEREHISTLAPKEIKLTPVPISIAPNMTGDEVEGLLQAPQGKDIKSLRDCAILHLLFSTGVRVSELCALNANIDMASDTLLVQGKGAKQRSVQLSTEAKDALHAFLHARSDTSEALFVNNGKRVSCAGETRLSVRSVQRIVKQYATQAGIKMTVTPHTLRHARAHDLLAQGADSTSVQTILGHETATSPTIYQNHT